MRWPHGRARYGSRIEARSAPITTPRGKSVRYDLRIQGRPEGFSRAIPYGYNRLPPLEMDFIVDYHTVGGTDSLF